MSILLEWQMHYTVYGLGKGINSVQCFQEEGRAFSTPEELLQAVNLYNMTQRTFRSELQVRCNEVDSNQSKLCRVLLVTCCMHNESLRQATEPNISFP